jgi:hypothetical protein
VEGGSLGDDGHAFLVVDGAVRELEVSSGALVPATSPSPFAGIRARGWFDISRSRTNLVEELHSGPAWRNFPVDDLPSATREEICVLVSETEDRCEAPCTPTCNWFTWILQVLFGWLLGWLFGFSFCTICSSGVL